MSESIEEKLRTSKQQRLTMDGMFKWAIGDVVTLAADPLMPQAPPYPLGGTWYATGGWRGDRHAETRYMVMGRIADECPGGVQLHYKCRMHTAGSISPMLIQFNEEELRALTPPEAVEPEPAAEGP